MAPFQLFYGHVTRCIYIYFFVLFPCQMDTVLGSLASWVVPVDIAMHRSRFPDICPNSGIFFKNPDLQQIFFTDKIRCSRRNN